MLAYYSSRLPAVEINNTFYRLPQPTVLENWAQQVPDSFKFSVKASQRITHFKRLQNTEEDTKYLFQTVASLGEKLGVMLFQLPPNFKKDIGRLEGFCEHLPQTVRSSFEFRHPTWFEDDVLELLKRRNIALCISDTDEMPVSHIDKTANWGYLRLRRVNYSDEALSEWLERIRQQNWEESFVFFKHEDEATGPKLAAHFFGRAGE